jgi:flagellar hook assembly protein FlgD
MEGNTEVANSGEMIVDQNIPNPFKNESHFKFTLPKDDVVNISIFDATGALIQTHQDSYKAGSHSYQLNGNNYPAGVYTYRVETSTASIAKKLIVIK